MSAANMIHPSIITLWRGYAALLRTTTGVVLFFFLWMNVHPALAAAKQEIQKPAPREAIKGLSADPHAQVEQRLQAVLTDLVKSIKPARDLVIKTTRKDEKGEVITDITIIGTPEAPAVGKHQKQLRELADSLSKTETEVLRDFARDEKHIIAHDLPQVIRDRHREAVTRFKANAKDLKNQIDALANATTVVALHDRSQALLDQLEAWQPKPAPFDPNKLGFQVETKKARAPKLTAKELKQVGQPLKTSLFDTEREIQVASAGSMAGLLGMSAVAAPGTEYLAPTIDVQITSEIQALAATLHHHPVEIYNWVRNNVEWIPTYGSVQGSQMTLDKKAGNAFDTSSLLIALLRASNIPARYAYGTIQVPIAQAMNWAGGFTHPDALQTFLATGGIPNNALTSGGVTKYIRMEHIWVEAFVDYYPSRGAKSIAPDAWVPMDASYKQYAYSEGLDLQGSVPFDAQDFLTSAQQGATVNEQEGWVQNLNQANIQIRLTAYQQQLQDFIESQDPDATVGEVLGAKTIQVLNAPVLAASLPYKLIATGNRYANLPDGMRHKFRYSLYQDSHQRAIENPLWTFEEATPNLASKKITLSFVPASDADRQTIESYLPKPHGDGSPIQPGEFPSSLPAYNIRVTGELRVEDNIVARGGTFTLGTELVGEGGFTYLHSLTSWDLTQEKHVAGQASALGLSLQGVSTSQLERARTRLQEVQAEVAAGGAISASGVKELTGDLLSVAIWSYFVRNESIGQLSQRRMGVVDVPALTYGFMHGEAVPEYRYGVVMRVRFPGVLMDVGHQRRNAFTYDGSTSEWRVYNKFRGDHASAMEHEIPDKYFLSERNPHEGVSSVRLLAVAAEQGQKIYRISESNRDQLANIDQSPGITQLLEAAIAAGKAVTIHERPVTHGGFTGAGYIVTDPETGTGSYLIEGGSNGGSKIIVAAILFSLGIVGFALAGHVLIAAALLVNYLATVLTIIQLASVEQGDKLSDAVDQVLAVSAFSALLAVLGGLIFEGAGATVSATLAFGTAMILFLKLYFP